MSEPIRLQSQSKYNAMPHIHDGIRFDSKAEYRHYLELLLLEKAGEITDLVVHPRIELQPAFETTRGAKYPAINYEADFQYVEKGVTITEDVKGVKTDVFILKRKLLLYKFPDMDFRIIEI